MFEQSFKNIDDVLHRDAGSATELDYIEQTSWILFLKYLDDLEQTKKTEAALAGKKHSLIINPQYRWEVWAEPKTADGKLDHNKALTGDDLRDFVNNKLFPYLKKFKVSSRIFDKLTIINHLKNGRLSVSWANRFLEELFHWFWLPVCFSPGCGVSAPCLTPEPRNTLF